MFDPRTGIRSSRSEPSGRLGLACLRIGLEGLQGQVLFAELVDSPDLLVEDVVVALLVGNEVLEELFAHGVGILGALEAHSL